ncbi:MAG: hypothetical protein M1827_005971 [Pycnora praestabilis]|nr:MAG: hypothetical protein M1827_005971 [Pycnora praestabilis]
MPLITSRPTSKWNPPGTMDSFLSSPLKFLVRHLYALFLLLQGPPYHIPVHKKPIRVVCISDTHCKTGLVPDGDLLIHAGDLTEAGTVQQIQAQIDWLQSLPHAEKIVIAGNHDAYFDPASRSRSDEGRMLSWGEIQYLQNSSVTLVFPEHNNRHLNIYGAPQIPICGGSNFAFQYGRHADPWSQSIPQETDILVTHTPPRYHLDNTSTALGCQLLLKEIWRVQPKLHVFGHIHAGHGKEKVFWDEGQKAYERVCARKDRGLIRDFFAVWAWLDVIRVILYGIQNVLWSRVWGGDARGGWMVNAALAYLDTGKLGNPVEMIEL